ncbi:MAG: hypothetical protein AB1724_12560 [Thermodesulfobacteriota bacterium]
MKTGIRIDRMDRAHIVRKDWKFFVCVIAALSVSLVWPGDSFWAGNEQAEILDLALQANSAHRLASYQRGGSTAAIPHPLTIWVYQLFLLVTHDVVKIIAVKQLMVLCASLAGLWYLSRILQFYNYPILIIFPSLCFYALSRQIEDSSFLVVLSMMLFVCYAWFYHHKGYVSLSFLAVCIVALVHNSHRGMIAAIPFVLCFSVFEYGWVRQHRLGVLVITLGALAVCSPYLMKIAQQFYTRGFPGDYPFPERSVSLAWLFTAVSGGIWYSYDLFQLIPDEYFDRHENFSIMISVLSVITMAAHLYLVLGLGQTISSLVRRFRQGKPLSLEDRFGVIALFTLIFYMMLLYVFRLFNHWIYHSGLWFCSFYFIWRAVSTFHREKMLKYVFPAYLVSMMVLWLGTLVYIHMNNDRLFTIQKATDLAAKIAAYSPESDIIQLVNAAEEAERLADLVIANSDRAFLGFYYRAAGLSLKSASRALQSLHVNPLYNALKPLVYIQRQGNNDFLPPRTLIIKKDDGPGKKGVVLIEDPAQVRVELNRLR